MVSLLDALEIPVLRWLGGCFADDYHWEDGIGPVEERPRRRNLFWAQGREDIPEESNSERCKPSQRSRYIVFYFVR